MTITTATSSEPIICAAWDGFLLEEATSGPHQVVAGGGQPGDHEESEHGDADDGQEATQAVPPPDHHDLEGQRRNQGRPGGRAQESPGLLIRVTILEAE